jgi:hypothetical protein
MNQRNKYQTARKPRLSTGRRTPLSTYYRGEPGPPTQSPFQSSPTKRSARRFIFGFLDIIILTLLIVGLIYSLILKPSPKMILSSSDYRGRSTYQSAADKIFSSLGNRNKLTFNEAGVVKQLRTQFPEISSASVELPFFSQQPILRIVISKPSLLLVSNGQQYVVDSQGVIAGKASDIKNSSQLTKVTDQSGFGARIGRPVLSSSDISFIRTLISETKTAKVNISNMTLPPAAQELDVRTSDQPYYTKFFLGGDVLRQIGQFLAARHNFAQKGSPPFEYLDVRVPGKIFYK